MRSLFYQFLGWCLGLGYFLYTRLLGRTLIRSTFDRHWRKSGNPIIRCHWHEDILMLVYRYAYRKMCIMASQSRDGDLIAGALKLLGFHVTRGSSSKGGRKALEGMKKALQSGFELSLAIDGPRGPRRVAKMGIVLLAKQTGLPIVPSATAAKWGVRLKSWDRMVVPLPFSPGVELRGKPIFVPEHASSELLELKRKELEGSLLELKDQAERYYWREMVPEPLKRPSS